jgi:hypothetical protein
MLDENEEVTMLKAAPVVAASALVVAVLAIAASGPAAMAAAPKCLNKSICGVYQQPEGQDAAPEFGL